MKNLFIVFALSVCSSSVYACFCFGEISFCNYIQSDDFINNNGIVCIAEKTGNTIGENFPLAYEMKIIELLHGEIQAGTGNYLNTDSTIWILTLVTSCNKIIYEEPVGEPYVIAPLYSDPFSSSTHGYQLFQCKNDIFPYESTMIGPIINDYGFNPDDIREIDTIAMNQLSSILNSCVDCTPHRELTGLHNYPAAYQNSSTIHSTATVNANTIYKANDRITLSTDFKTDPAIYFGVRVDGCE